MMSSAHHIARPRETGQTMRNWFGQADELGRSSRSDLSFIKVTLVETGVAEAEG